MPAPLRVLHVRNSDRMSGPERLLLDQARHAAADIDPSLLVFQTRGERKPLLDAAASAGVAATGLLQSGSYDRRLKHRFVRWLREHPVDVLVTHDYKANWIGALAASALGLPCVAIVHGYTGENLKVRLFERSDRRRLRRFDAVVVVSEALADRLIQVGVERELIHLVDNTVDVQAVRAEADCPPEGLRESLGGAPGMPLVMTVGRLSPEKGHARLLDALAHPLLREQDWRLALLGDGPCRGALAQQVRRAGWSDRVHFAGWRTDAPACLGVADLHVLPSLTEGLPLALLEAMAVGCPTLATDVGGTRAALNPPHGGWCVAPDDAPALAAALQEALAGSELRAERAAHAQRRVAEHYDVRSQAQALEAIYRAVAERDTLDSHPNSADLY